MRSNSKVAYLGAFGVGNCADDFLITAFAVDRRPDLLIGVAPLPAFADTAFIEIEEAARVIGNHDLVICGGNFIWSYEQLLHLVALGRIVFDRGNLFEIRSVHIEHATVSRDPDTFLELAKLATKFTVRDNDSLRRAACLGVSVGFERDWLATYFERNFGEHCDDQRPFTISFNFHNTGEQRWNWYFEFLAALNHFAGTQVRLMYITQCRHTRHWPANERLVAEYLFSRFRGNVVITDSPQTPADLAAHYAASDLFISNRTHGLLIANAMGVTTAAVGGEISKSDAIALDCQIPLFYSVEDPVLAAKRFAATDWNNRRLPTVDL